MRSKKSKRLRISESTLVNQRFFEKFYTGGDFFFFWLIWNKFGRGRLLSPTSRLMKLLLLLTSAAALVMASCSSGPIDLNRNALTFGQEGADFGECGIVSQFEKGRSSSSQSAGGG